MTIGIPPTVTGNLSASRGVAVFVPGYPAPQGSKRHLGNGVMVESSQRVAPWRHDVRETLLALNINPIEGPVVVGLEFVLPRPASTPKRRTPAAVKRPDVDKLIRAVLDAISSAGLWRDDAQVVHLTASKRLAEIREKPGCHLRITSLDEKQEIMP